MNMQILEGETAINGDWEGDCCWIKSNFAMVRREMWLLRAEMYVLCAGFAQDGFEVCDVLLGAVGHEFADEVGGDAFGGEWFGEGAGEAWLSAVFVFVWLVAKTEVKGRQTSFFAVSGGFAE